MLRAVLFDLDDTLYRELDFVVSALGAVAQRAATRVGVPAARIEEVLRASLAVHGRGRTIDGALLMCGIPPARVAAVVPELVATYRGHRPAHLALHPDAGRCLAALRARGLSLGLVTDGDPGVQRAKVAALGLEGMLDVLRFTWDAGPDRQKPHPMAFEPALAHLSMRGIEPRQVAYVGDDPRKDFVGARALGLATVRVTRGPNATRWAPEELEADVAFPTLDALVPWLDGAAARSAAR